MAFMACWGWLTTSFIAGLVLGFAGYATLRYFLNKNK